MKYLFVITGIAYGHFTREEAIISKLIKKDKKAQIFIASYGTAYGHFRGKYKLLKLEPMFWPDELVRVQFFNTLLKNYRLIINWIINGKRINEFFARNEIDIVISDWEPFAIFLKSCKYLIWNYKPRYAKTNNVLVMIEKFSISTAYFLSRLFRKKLIIPSLNGGISKNIIYTGLIVRKTPEEIKPLMKYKNSILVMIGGSNFGSELARKIENISGKFNEKFIFFNHKCISKNCIGYQKFRNNYLSYLKSCKAVISLGGYSGISESLFFKKPNLAFPIKNWIEQMAVVEEFKDYIEIGDIESSEEELEIIIRNFLKNIPNLMKRLNTLKLNNGADEIAEIISK